MKLKALLIPALLVIAAVFAAWYFLKPAKAKKESLQLTTLVKQGDFKVKVTATGELKAKRSEKIIGPQGMRTVGIWQTNITDLVAEGTMVSIFGNGTFCPYSNPNGQNAHPARTGQNRYGY